MENKGGIGYLIAMYQREESSYNKKEKVSVPGKNNLFNWMDTNTTNIILKPTIKSIIKYLKQ